MLILIPKKNRGNYVYSELYSPNEANFPFYFGLDLRGRMQAQISHGRTDHACRSVYNPLKQEGVLKLPSGPKRLKSGSSYRELYIPSVLEADLRKE